MTIEEFKDSFEDFVSNIGDPRIDRTKAYPLEEILFLTLVGLICGCSGWCSLERFGKDKIKLLKKFYPFKNGTPSDDTLRRLFRRISPNGLKDFLHEWVASLKLTPEKIIAIDGKASCSSINSLGGQLNTVTAYATEHQLSLSQVKCSDKSNEITAIPKLIKLIEVKKSLITIDAVGAQTEICTLIVSQGGDYCIAIKRNQKTLFDAVIEQFENTANQMKLKTESLVTKDRKHGRIEERNYQVIDATECPKLMQIQWPGLKSVIKVISSRIIKGKESICERYYISSLSPNIQLAAKAIRSHWAIENNLHWILDTAFKDDESKISKGNAPQNMMIIKQLTLNWLKKAKLPRESIKLLRESCGWNDENLMRVLSHIHSI